MNNMVYTEEELQFLLDNYGLLGAKECARRMGKSFWSIKYMARKHEVRHNPRKLWTTAEVKKLQQFYPIIGRKGCAELLDRSLESISCKVSTLGIYSGIGPGKLLGDRNPNTKLPDAVVAELRVNRHRIHPGVTVRKLAEIYGVSEDHMSRVLLGKTRIYNTVWSEECRIAIPALPKKPEGVGHHEGVGSRRGLFGTIANEK